MYYFIRLDVITLLGCVSKEKDWFHPCGYWNRISISTLFCFWTGEFRFLDQFNVISVFGIWVLNIVSCICPRLAYTNGGSLVASCMMSCVGIFDLHQLCFGECLGGSLSILSDFVILYLCSDRWRFHLLM